MVKLFYAQNFSRRLDDLFPIRRERLFKHGARGYWRQGRADAGDRTVEVVERFLLNPGDDFRADTALFDSFMNNNQAAGFLYGLHNRFNIEGRDRARIDQFNGNSLLRQFIGGCESRTDHARQSDDRYMFTLPRDSGSADRYGMIAIGNLSF